MTRRVRIGTVTPDVASPVPGVLARDEPSQRRVGDRGWVGQIRVPVGERDGERLEHQVEVVGRVVTQPTQVVVAQDVQRLERDEPRRVRRDRERRLGR